MNSGKFGQPIRTNRAAMLSNRGGIMENSISRRLKAKLGAVIAVVMAVGAGLPMAQACSCTPPSPCQANFCADAVFLGSVTEALDANNGRILRARIRVDHAYKGVSQETLILLTNWRACADLDLQVGGQYLMYADRLENGDVATAGCSR